MSFFSQIMPFQSARPISRGTQPANGEREYAVPAYEVKESNDAFGLEVIMPGVHKDAVEINVDQGELNEAVDVEKINAELEHGVLRVTLPKAEALKPRRIDVS